MSVFVESVGLSTISQEFQHLLVSLRGICTGKRSQKDFVGSGRQKIVHLHPADRTKVIAEFRPESAPSHERALGHLEMGKLLHVLFPEHFPRIFYAKKGGKFCIEYIEADQAKKASLAEINQLSLKFRKLGITLDSAESNFKYRDGNLVYVDSVSPWSEFGHAEYSLSALVEFIQTLTDEKQKVLALKHVRRMELLRRKTEERFTRDHPA